MTSLLSRVVLATRAFLDAGRFRAPPRALPHNETSRSAHAYNFELTKFIVLRSGFLVFLGTASGEVRSHGCLYNRPLSTYPLGWSYIQGRFLTRYSE